MLDEFIPDFIGKGYPGARFRLLGNDESQLMVGLYMLIKVEGLIWAYQSSKASRQTSC